MPGQTVAAGMVSTFDVGFWPSASAIHHEDLTDVMTILDSFQTPFFSGAPKIRARDVVHSWPIDTLTAVSSAGAQEGSDHAADAMTTPQRLYNGTQIFRRDVQVSDRERVANPAGIRDMYEHQIMKEMKVLARNCEYTIFRNNSTASATGLDSSAATNAPVMAGLRGVFGGGGTIPTSGVTGLAGFVTGDMVSVAQSLFVGGGEPDSLWLAPSSKLQFVNVTMGTAINVRNIAASDQRLVANIDVFETPFGQLFAVITDRFIPMGTATASGYAYFVGDRSMAKLAFYRPPQHKEIAKSGDSTKGIVLMELTLELTHPSAWAAVTNVTGASGLVV